MPAGLSILTGGAKVGKSYLALNLALGVTLGGRILGHFDALKGGVLYLALEDTRLVLIDTLQMFMERPSGKGSAYRKDYQAISEIKKLTDEFNVAILAVHPLRECVKGGCVSLFSGSRGIADVADTIFCLERRFKSRTATLRRVIRGVTEEQFTIT